MSTINWVCALADLNNPNPDGNPIVCGLIAVGLMACLWAVLR